MKDGETIMCCCRINTEVLLANLFAKSEKSATYTLDNLKDYLKFLAKGMPIYLSTNFSKKEVLDCVEIYSDLYRISKKEGETIIIHSGNEFPNLEFFNAAYPASMSEYIKKVTSAYVKNMQRWSDDK